ncbi:MAG: c-type cytochrome [Gemmatimonadales bacterium]|jgi:cytochrome c553
MSGSGTRRRETLLRLVLCGAAVAFTPASANSAPAARLGDFLLPDTSGAQLYEVSCAACHGSDGKGQSPSQVAFADELPDFSDCNFASREPDADWFAVIHDGGPVRAFSPMMPAFGEALSDEQIQSVLDHVRVFCGDDSWPRGELNLPRALVTEKAYLEDEAVLTTIVATEGPGSVITAAIFEKRIGARSQLEVTLPLAVENTGDPEGWQTGFGDLDIGYKYALFHSLQSGSVLSLGADLVIPTGAEQLGFGRGTTVFEPYLAFGQFLPLESFLQLQTVVEFPADRDLSDELFVRAALGRTWNAGRWGRAWTPMLEVVALRDLESGADTNWDLIPQMQVTLNRRQHVMLNLGVRLPLTNADRRNTLILAYLLWDWFDGGFLAGW